MSKKGAATMKTIFSKAIVVVFIFSFIAILSQENNNKKPDSVTDSSKTRKVQLIIRNAPKLTLEFSLFYDYGVYELSGNYNGDFNPEQFVNGENFGVRHGIGGMVTAKIPLHKRGNIRANVSLEYNVFSSKFNKSLSNVSETDFMKYNIYSGILGIENNFTPNFKFKTYAGIGLIASIISGNGRITDEKSSNDLEIIPAFRLGISVNSGVEYMISNKFGMNCGIRFTHANIWLKETKASDDPNEIYLNDSRTSSDLRYGGFKQFAWGSFFIGMNYYIGVKEKTYIYTKR